MDFFQCLQFGTDFLLWYSCFPGWELKLRPSLSTVQGKYIYIFFKAENQEIQFPLLCTKTSKDKHKFFVLQRLAVTGQFIVQLCLACTISLADLAAKRATIIEWSGLIYRPNVPIRQDFWVDLSTYRSQKGLTFHTCDLENLGQVYWVQHS